MVSRAIVNLVDDATKLQALQVTMLADETSDQVERVQKYGFTSVPHPDSEAIALAVGGSRDHVVVICVDDRRYRLKGLQSGEVAIYTDEGDSVVLKRGNVIEVTAATKVRIVSPLVEMSGDLVVSGDASVGGTATAAVDVIGGGKSLKGHKHGGVTAGGAQTGVPA
jgi:phage baseplate assembly protein V